MAKQGRHRHVKLAWVLHLYPRAWRERYEQEFLAVLEQHPATAMTWLDVLLGALDAHLYPQVEVRRMLSVTARLRTAVITVLWAWVGFVFAGMGFQKLSEDPPYHALAQAHPLVGLSFNLVIVGAVASLLALAAGGLPIAYTAFRAALAERRGGILALFALPLVAAVVAVGGTLLLVRYAAEARGTLHGPLALGILVTLWLVAAAVSTAAGSVVVSRSAIGERLFDQGLRWGVAVAAAMGVVTLATLAWGIGLRQYAPDLYFGHGGVMRSVTAGSWLRIVSQMALFTLLAVWAVVRGWRSRAAA